MKMKQFFKAIPLLLSVLANPTLASETFTYTFLEGEAVKNDSSESGFAWDGHGWIGGDYNKFSWKTEGETHEGELDEAEVRALYSRLIAPFWDLQAGVRYDFEPEGLAYATIGVSGLAPYLFEVDAAAFLSEEGDVSARIELEYELLFTQRLIGSPHLEVEAFVSDVPELGMGSGLAIMELGFQLRYEVTRKLAPYIDLTYEHSYGGTADYARAAGEGVESTAFHFGLRIIF